MFLSRLCVVLRKVPLAAPNRFLPVVQSAYSSPCNACQQNRFTSSISNKTIEAEEVQPSALRKFFNKIPFLNIEENRLGVAGYLLYESIADKINYAEFFEEFSLPDTFYSWFAITELHIWLLMVRCMAEGDDGRIVRNKMVEALWVDVGLRVKKIGAGNPMGMRLQVAELSEQFQAALIAYDEGLQDSDMVLAGALWRRLYQQGEVDPEHLEGLVKYIRRQMLLLDNKSRVELFRQKSVTWEPIAEKH